MSDASFFQWQLVDSQPCWSCSQGGLYSWFWIPYHSACSCAQVNYKLHYFRSHINHIFYKIGLASVIGTPIMKSSPTWLSLGPVKRYSRMLNLASSVSHSSKKLPKSSKSMPERRSNLALKSKDFLNNLHFTGLLSASSSTTKRFLLQARMR